MTPITPCATGVGGVLVRWATDAAAPAWLDLLSDGAHVVRERVLPLSLDAPPNMPGALPDNMPAVSVFSLFLDRDSPLRDPGFAYGLVPVGEARLHYGGGRIELSDGTTRHPLPGVREAVPLAAASVALTVTGGYVHLSVGRLRGKPMAAMPVYVTIDGRMLAFATLSGANDERGVLVVLPTEVMDGQHHWIEVRGGLLGEPLHRAAHRIDAIATPGDALQQYTSRIDRPGLLPYAEQRYQGLTAALKRVARAPDAGAAAELARISDCHAYVLRGPQPRQTRFDPRVVPCHADPDFSIIIPAHNKFPYTYLCVNALLYTCAGLSYEVILVDDGSSDATRDAARILPGARIVRHDEAQGFVGACNAGAALARGRHLVFLNNDTEPLGEWLEELRFPFLAFDDVGLTGAKLVYPDGRLQEAGGIVWGNGAPWNYGRGSNFADPRFNYTRPCDYASGAALMIPRALWEEIGGFDARYAPGFYEDTDLAFAVRERGQRTLYAPKSVVIHHEGVSAGTDKTAGMKRFQVINRPKFEERWHTAFAAGGAEGKDPDLEKDRGMIGRALVLDYQSPRFDRDAGSFAISQEIRMLQALGYKVTIAPGNSAHLGIYTDAFERAGCEHLYAPFYTSLADVIERRGAEFDLIYIHRFPTAAGLIPLIRRRAPQAKVALNCADVHFLRELRAARLAGSAEAFDSATKTRNAEVAVFRQCDVVLTYSDVERGVIEAHLGLQANVRLLPWIAEPADPALLDRAREGIVFLGSYDHAPNRDAVDFFLTQCWPSLRERHPHARFHIVGSGFDTLRDTIADDRVVVSGWIEDIVDFLGDRALMVAPLRVGAGMKGKVVDALRAGTPCVLSPVAAEGMRLEEGIAANAETADEWIAQVGFLLGDPDARRDMARRSHAFVDRSYSEANGQRAFAAILASLGLPWRADAGGLVQRASLREQPRLFAAPLTNDPVAALVEPAPRRRRAAKRAS